MIWGRENQETRLVCTQHELAQHTAKREEELPARRRTSGGGGRGTRGGRGTARQNTHNQVDAQLVMRLVVSSVEPDKQHWSYWLSNFGYETRKIEKVKYDQKCTL